MMGVSIVRIGASNVGLLERVAADVFDGPLEPERLGNFLADGRHPDKPPQFFFNEVGVSPDWSSRGIGRRLSAALIEEARARGCESIWLATAVDNTPAHRCFEAVPEGEPPQMCRIYAWDLAD
jgi:ribosomal protein S18 acetylase RimI-like enzyme